MSSLREEILQEMKNPRVDKKRLFDLLLKIVDNGAADGVGPQGPPGPAGPIGPAGPAGPAGPIGECKCKCNSEAVAKKPSTTTKKTGATTKKKTVAQ